MKNVSVLVLTAALAVALSGCGTPVSATPASQAQPAETSLAVDPWGLELSVKNVTPTGATLVISQSGGNPSGELRYGTAYQIQSLQGDTWQAVPYATEDNVAWTSEAYLVERDTVSEVELSWEWLYGSLPTGQYRLVKQFMDFRGTGDYDEERYEVAFEIT